MFFADPKLNRITAFNLETKSYTWIPLHWKNPHSVDRAWKTDKLYVRTQDSYSFDVIDWREKKYLKTVPLWFKPRAAWAYNDKLNLQLVTWKDVPKIAIIDVKTDNVLRVVWKTWDKEVTSQGWDSATGHAIWVDKNHFVLTDRVHEELAVYTVVRNEWWNIDVSSPIIIDMPAWMHNIEKIVNATTDEERSVFYASTEWNTATNTTPSVVELKIVWGKLEKGRRVVLWNNINTTVHHIWISPDKKYIYAPTFDWNVYIIDRKSFKITKILKAWKWAWHISFSKETNVVAITNHFENFVTIIDFKKQKVIKNIQITKVKFNPDTGGIMQAHNNFISSNWKYFLVGSTKDWVLNIIDLYELKIKVKIETGWELEQTVSKVRYLDWNFNFNSL